MLRHTKCVQLAQADLLTVIRCVHRRSEAPNTQLFRVEGRLPERKATSPATLFRMYRPVRAIG